MLATDPPSAHVCYPKPEFGHFAQILEILFLFDLCSLLFVHVLVAVSIMDAHGAKTFVVGCCMECWHFYDTWKLL